MPAASASGGVRVRPVSIRSSAFWRPMRRGSRCVPPVPGSSPRVTSGRPMRYEPSAAIRKSQQSAISRPPPRQCPLIAATTTFGVLSNLPIASFAQTTNALCASRLPLANTEMSAPAEKKRSLALRTTIAFTLASRRASSIAESSSSRKERSYELAGGRSSTMCPTLSCFSRRTDTMHPHRRRSLDSR